MQKQNLLLFIVISALILGGWWWWQFHWLEQPKPADDSVAKAKDKDKDKKDTKKETKTDDKKPPEEKPDDKKQPNVEPPPPVGADEIARDLQLGDPEYPKYNYYILATVSTAGGGIRNLTLPKFQKASENGKPVFDDGRKVPLQLIEDDPVMASFLMFHYPTPADEKVPCSTTLGQKIWKVVRHETTASKSELVLSFDQIPGYDGLKIVKTYTLRPKEYHISLTIEIRDERADTSANKARDFRYQLAGAHGLPIEGDWYSSVYRTPMMGILNDRGNLERDLDETQYRISVKEGGDRWPLVLAAGTMLQYGGVATQYFASLIVVDNEQKRGDPGGVSPDEVLAYCRPTLESEEIHGVIQSIDPSDPKNVKLKLLHKGVVPGAIQRKGPVPAAQTFLLLPRTKSQLDTRGLKVGDEVFVSFYHSFDDKLIATGIRAGSVRRRQVDDITVRAVSNTLKLTPGKHIVHKYLLYHGPSKVRLLAQFTGDEAVAGDLVDRYADQLHLSTLTDYRSAGPFGAISSTIRLTDLLILTTGWMHWLLYWLHVLVPNYGLTIILLTLIVRGSMFPISRRTAQLSIKMQALAPEMKKVQEKYKDDPQAKTAAMMELYRKHGVNPLGSCLPLMLQMPFFLGLYYCLQESIHFRLAGFLWMDNLAAPDMLLRWGEGIWMISDPDNMFGSFLSFLYLGPYFNILPVFAVTLMFLQQKMLTPPPADEQQEMQQKMMKYMFIFMGIFFYKVAAGLCVYFIASSLWGLAERKMLPKKKPVVATTATGQSGGGGGGGGAGGGGGSGGPNRGKSKPAKKDKDKKPETTIQKVKDWWAEVLRSAQKK
jgi:YidC/Oxa1 family membrane protein insertase